MRAVIFILSAVVALVAFDPPIQAQTKKKKKPKKVLVSFDEDLVQGQMTGAELFLILQKKQARFDRLFDLRENFLPEMRKNVETLK